MNKHFLKKINKTKFLKNTIINMKTLIYIICINDEMYNLALKEFSNYIWAKPIIIKCSNHTFENIFWEQLENIESEWIDCLMVGIIPYYNLKNINIYIINDIIINKKYLPNNYYCFINNNSNIFYNHNFSILWENIINLFDFKESNDYYCYNFICKPYIMKQYIYWYNNICLPKLFNNTLVLENSCVNYLKKNELTNIWGKEYYPIYPFLIERLNKYFLDNIFLNKICIIHCGNINIFNEILNDYSIIKNMKLIITYYNDDYYNIILTYNLNIIKLIKVENKGTDCGPFLLVINFLLKNNNLFDEKTIFYKIHTKSMKDWRNNLIQNMIYFNNVELFNNKPSIFGSIDYLYDNRKDINRIYIKDIIMRNNLDINKYNKYIDIYHDDNINPDNKSINKFTDLYPNEKFYNLYEPDLKYYNIKHWYNHGINEYHRISNINYIKTYANYELYFIAGTIFGFNSHYLDLYKNINLDYEYSILEEGYLNNHNPTKLHSWEYFFSTNIILNDGNIFGLKYNKDNDHLYLKKTSNIITKVIPKYSIINQPFYKSRIGFFMLVPGDIPNSGGYRTLLKYIKLLNNNNYQVDLYFGICWNRNDINENIYNIDEYGMPLCSNWLNHDKLTIEELILNIEKYNEIDINKNNYFLGLKCQKDYDIIFANAWQISEAVYLNKESARKIVYIIQDREELFYPNDHILQESVITTYHNDFHYYCITQYLYNYFKNHYKLSNVVGSYMGVNLNKYYNKNLERSNNGIVIPYYDNIKSGRKPELVEKIINILSENNYKCFVYPYKYLKNTDKNIINLGNLDEEQLNNLYNEHKVGIIFSDTNPSRLGYEMYASGLHVIEYDSEFTKYDMPNEYFYKIKDEINILNDINILLNKNYNDVYVKNIDNNNDDNLFINFINGLMQ